MDDRESVIKHLEMIQNVINRLAHNSFLIKGWSLTILVAVPLFTLESDNFYRYNTLVMLIPIITFWGLDAYFLQQERLFRGVYDEVRESKITDFSMNIKLQKSKLAEKWVCSLISRTLLTFYGMQIFFLMLILCPYFDKLIGV